MKSEETRRQCYWCQDFNLLCGMYITPKKMLVTICPACIAADQLGMTKSELLDDGE